MVFSMDEKLNEFARLILRDRLIELDSVAIEMRQKGWSVETSCFESACETIVDHFDIKFVDSPGTYIKFTEKDDIKCV